MKFTSRKILNHSMVLYTKEFVSNHSTEWAETFRANQDTDLYVFNASVEKNIEQIQNVKRIFNKNDMSGIIQKNTKKDFCFD